MRARKPKNIQERLERYSNVIENAPSSCKGRWLAVHGNGCESLHVDLGCGKGAFSIESAKRNPQTLYVAIDCEDLCIALGAQRATEAGVANVVFVHGDANNLLEFFDENEIALLHLNFSTPFPKRRYAKDRLCYMDKLISYRSLLAQDGEIWMKTDSQPLFDFALTQFEIAGYHIEWMSRDMHAEPIDDVQTEYETRLSELGAKIHGLVATVGVLEEEPMQTAQLSLQYYLPENLDDIEYIPYGMEAFVTNMRNRRKKEEARAKRA